MAADAAAQRMRIEAGFASRRRDAGSADHVWQARIAGVCRVCRLGLLQLGYGAEDAAAAMKGLRRDGNAVLAGWGANEECGALAFARVIRHADFFLNFGCGTQDLWGGQDMMRAITRAAVLPGSQLPVSLQQMSTVEVRGQHLVVTTYIGGGYGAAGASIASLNPCEHPVLLRGPGHYNGLAKDRNAKVCGAHGPVTAAGDQTVLGWLERHSLFPVPSTPNGYCWYESMVWSLRALSKPVLVETLLTGCALGDETALGGGALF